MKGFKFRFSQFALLEIAKGNMAGLSNRNSDNWELSKSNSFFNLHNPQKIELLEFNDPRVIIMNSILMNGL